MRDLGCTLWAIPEGYIPSDGVSDAYDLVSHEAACFLNTGDTDAEVRITLFFETREPVGPYLVRVPARRTLHMRFNDLTDPAPVPRDTSYASLIEASSPIVVQHTRLDSRQPAMALLTTVAFPAT
ncbi:sensory rhodopsin transducer [Bradyrhizobium guangdongense]|uniref:Sensory rhodopsin transducer n=1 Tax=Bradyrhizobium guangdongense TaxID=1325090 RepID=A0A410V9F3_9BRAD|nr:sensory rhodopsin transducer [Bradyrhizobium guangdongense]QAU40256.1 sensory rhodopsin transducer [Bradyrhizobium guangdongense]QOZ61321.1 sensory rhodopsin transducer [Bradyrhizobium guangdongense]GGI22918.1 hypothetical protein GCM10010987_21800 [Bradyrhizobium guangdongense]